MNNYPRHIVFTTGIVRNTHGQILMIKSPMRGWEPPGGQVELGEDAIEAWIREVKEESGYDIAVTCLVSVIHNIGGPNSEPKLGLVFKGILTGGEARRSNESLEVGWFSQEKALELMEFLPNLDRLKDVLTFTGKVNYKVYQSRPEFRVLRELG